jgi:hypothetical protein
MLAYLLENGIIVLSGLHELLLICGNFSVTHPPLF